MGLHSRSSHSVWNKPLSHKPFIVSSLQDPIVLTDDSQSAVPFTVFDPDIDFLVQSQSNIYLRAASQCCSLNLRWTCTHACYFTNSAHSVNMSYEVNLVGIPKEFNGQLRSIVVKLTENYVGTLLFSLGEVLSHCHWLTYRIWIAAKETLSGGSI
jgi:hypothetical protein